MITPKQWKDFNKYRNNLYEDIFKSEAFKQIGEESRALLEQHKNLKFYESGMAFIWDINQKLQQRDSLFYRVPPKTVEACLDWLASRKRLTKLI